MHCQACEVLLENRLKNVAGVKTAKVSLFKTKAVLNCENDIPLNNFREAVKNEGYDISYWQESQSQKTPDENKFRARDFKEIGLAFLVVMGLYLILKQLSLLPQGFGVKEGMSLWFVFVIGLVAAVSSCMAVTGGLILGLSAKHNQAHPELSGAAKFKPYLYFNLGRLFGYAIFGLLVGALGSALSLSLKANGFFTVIASLIMITLGLNLLKLFPGLTRFLPRMPKWLGRKIHSFKDTGSGGHKGSFILGAFTFFLPCGFTQALQLYVLSQGQALEGGIIMLVFALGTLPALLSISALASFVKSSWQRYFVKFAGILIIFLGVFNLTAGLSLTGFTLKGSNDITAKAGEALDPNVRIIDGKQVVRMEVVGYNYKPANFTVKKNIPVEWQIDGTKAAGCARVIAIPALKKNQILSSYGITTIVFNPTKEGKISFFCSMGMTTPGAAFKVVN